MTADNLIKMTIAKSVIGRHWARSKDRVQSAQIETASASGSLGLPGVTPTSPFLNV